jgi:hypothetical protein
MLVDGTDYAFLHVSKFVQFEPDKLIDVRTELYSLAGNKVGNVCHSGLERKRDVTTTEKSRPFLSASGIDYRIVPVEVPDVSSQKTMALIAHGRIYRATRLGPADLCPGQDSVPG